VPEPAYARLQLDERRKQLIDAGLALFMERSYDSISMRQIAKTAGVSKALLYHYFPSKVDLFMATVADQASELQTLIQSTTDGTPEQRLVDTLDAYLRWIERHALAWAKLMQSAATIPEVRAVVVDFRGKTLARIVEELTGNSVPSPRLRTALEGWLGYMDAAILDWIEHRDLSRDELRDILLNAFGASVVAGQAGAT
jgi:AcrR family transcriptional regulator